MEKGLETRNIRSTFKDSRGFIWISTDVGAYRFDGFKFHPYKRNIKHNIPLSVERVAEDDAGNLWFYHFNYSEGLSDFSILPIDSDVLIPIEEYFEEDELPFSLNECFYNIGRFDTTSGIWLASRKTREIFEYINGAFKKLGTLPDFAGKSETAKYHHFSIDKDSKGVNWLAYEGDLYFSNSESGFEKHEKIPLPSCNLIIDNTDQFWFVYQKEIYIKPSKDAPITKPEFLKKLDLNEITEFEFESINNQFIVASRGNIGNLLLIDHSCNQVTSIDNPAGKHVVGKITPSHVYIDQPNTVWLSTYEGLFQIAFQQNPFKKHLKGKSTRGIIESDKGNIFVASYSGFFEIEPISGKEKLIDQKLNNGQGIYIDSKDNCWLGGGVSNFHKINAFNPFYRKAYQFDRIGGTLLNFFELNGDSNLWMGTDFGLCIYNEQQDRFEKYQKLNGFTEFNNSTIYDFESIDESNFFIATSKGLFQLDINKGIVNHFCSSNNKLPYDYITFAHRDRGDGTYWFGTKLGGLIHWDFPKGQPIQITTKDELADNTIYAIYEDKVNENHLWLPSNNGLMHYSKKTGEVTNYKTKDGILHDEFNFYSHFEAKDSTLYFGGIQGVTSFDPKEIVVTEQRPALHLVSLKYDDNDEKHIVSCLNAFNIQEPIVFNSTSKSFNITVALNDYFDSNESKYFSKIEGIDNNWVPMEENSLLIKTLPTGSYQISIKAKNGRGIWAKNQINIPIKKTPPFYQSWWFRVLMLLLLIGVIATLIKARTYKLTKDKERLEKQVAIRTEQIEEDKRLIEKQAEELQELDKIKSRFFSNVTHELRTPLTLIIGPLKQLLKSGNIESRKVRKTLESIAQNSDELKQLVEEILDLNRLDAKKITLNKEPVRLRNVVEKWITSFDPEAENRKIQFKIDYLAATNLYLNLDVQKLDRIVINLLSNAFKYSESGDTILLRIREGEGEMQIIIEDTGLGIHKDDLPNIFQRFYQTKQAENNLMGGLGIGLALSKELSNLMGGNITVESELNKGSIFTFNFPKEISEQKMVPTYFEQKEVEIKDRIDIIGNSKKKNILIVEDNAKMQVFVNELLEPLANTQIANNGKVALDLLKTNDQHFDLIVSDVMMPEMDGFTLLENLKKDKNFQLTPVVLLTARADIHDKINALTIGVDDYIVKPFEPAELIARVKNLLQKVDLSNAEDTPTINASENEYKIINEFDKADSVDLLWLKEVEQIALKHINQSSFNVSQFAFKVHISERQLGRKLKKLTGMTTGNYLKEVRLQKARHLLENKTFSTISEVAFSVGFATPDYFTKIFKKRFGTSPKEFVNK